MKVKEWREQYLADLSRNSLGEELEEQLRVDLVESVCIRNQDRQGFFWDFWIFLAFLFEGLWVMFLKGFRLLHVGTAVLSLFWPLWVLNPQRFCFIGRAAEKHLGVCVALLDPSSEQEKTIGWAPRQETEVTNYARIPQKTQTNDTSLCPFPRFFSVHFYL